MGRKFTVIYTQMDIIARAMGPFVVVGKYFEHLPRDEALAVVSHEMGHIEMRHLAKRLWWVFSFRWKGMKSRLIDHEFEADAYAVRKGHGRGLLKLLGRISDIHKSPLHPTKEDRINRIKNQMELMNGQ